MKNGLFDTHVLNEKGFKEVEKYKSALSLSINECLSLMPEGREKAIFKTKIEEAAFFGTKAIAGKEGNFDSIKEY